jgi:hypothetical protein
MADQNKIQDDILSYREMCDAENIQTLQRGMNFRMNQSYSVILMSQRANAPYHDRVYDDGVTIEYEGHDTSKRSTDHNPKNEDQPDKLPTGRLTQNGMFIKATNKFKKGDAVSELIKVYEKIIPGVWLACTRFRRHRVRCFNGTGGGSWSGGSLHASSSLRRSS